MFEGVVSQVLAGYLGRYVKGIQKEQLKVGLWNEEILLEKVELILEAFDYLQLPFSLKNGRIGKLSIKIPWKRLGWEPIIIVLEDIFLCACQREDNEWSADSVEVRELAGKMAKLNAIELAKFSRRVSDNHAGQSFITYISTKILDSIQVSIRNVHIVYIDSHNYQGEYVFGLKFSTLTVMTDTTKHSSTVSSVVKSKGGQVSKIVEISSVGLYCNMFEAAEKLEGFAAIPDSKEYQRLNSDNESYNFLLLPFDVKISLQANKSRKLSSAYTVDIEPTALAVTLSEMQLHQILSLFDYFSICILRERYGRFRPSHISLSRKLPGWQRMWWQYAQNAVLIDVRHKLWKTSWSSLGKRINERRKYVNLYKRKLELIQQELVVSKDILLELEEMDRVCYIDDILNYRSCAEQKMQELSKMKTSTTGTNDERLPSASYEKQQHDDRSSSSARGWLNWLSLGMLGAGGTADSSSFAGVVSDEIIKDIYEATEFNPVGSFTEDSCRREKFLFSVRFNICQIGATILSKYEKKILEAILKGISAECEFSETSSALAALIDSITLIDPFNRNILLIAKKVMMGESSSLDPLPFVNARINIQKSDQSSETLIKVVLQPFDATYESEFYLKVLELCDVLVSFQFLHKRVLLSFNGFKDFKDRLLFKAEYVSHNSRKIKWDVVLHSFVIKFPFVNEDAEPSIMLLESEGLFIKSMPKTERVPNLLENSPSYDYELTSSVRDIMDNGILNFQLQDFYEQIEIGLTAFEVKLSMPSFPVVVSVLEKCNPIFEVRFCIFMDEPILKPVEVNCLMTLLCVRFSQKVLSLFIRLYELSEKSFVSLSWRIQRPSEFDIPNVLGASFFSFSLKLDHFNIHVDLEDDVEYDSVLLCTVNKIAIRFTDGKSNELCCLIETIMLGTSNLKHEQDKFILCQARSSSTNSALRVPVEYDCTNLTCVACTENLSSEYCFQLRYKKSYVQVNTVQHDYSIFLCEVDFHVYPRICGLLVRFFNRINDKYFSSTSFVTSLEVDQDDYNFDIVGIKHTKFGFSNFCASDPALCECISVDTFPFVTIGNSGSPSNLDTSIIHSINGFQEMSVIDKQCPRSHKTSINKRSTIMSHSTVGNGNCASMEDHQITIFYDIILLDIKVDNVKVHFHDSSCILGTVSVPQFRSTISLQGTSCWDVLVSTDKLLFSSSWSSHEVVWGSSSLGISNVLNIRARKEEKEMSVQISFGLQHVSCILTPEFLAILIGYFSLPDWTFKGSMKTHELCSNFGNESDKHLREESNVIYKFEILDSILILPVENLTDFVLQVNIPRFYCNFMPASSPDIVFKDIPFDCVVTSIAIANKLDIINVFGRSLSLSVVPVKDDADYLFKHCEYVSTKNIPLIEQLEADLWLRIPCKMQNSVENFDFPSLIMMRVDTCKLIVEEKYFIDGLEATVNVADQLSLIGKESECFRCDVLQFMQLKKRRKDEPATILDMTDESFVIMKICVRALSIKFSHLSEKQSSPLETIAKAYVRLECSTTLRNGLPKSLNVDISSLLLHSFLSDVLLVSFTSDGDVNSRLVINFCRWVDSGPEIVLAIPSLDVWLHMPDWDGIYAFLASFKNKFSMTLLSTTATPGPPRNTPEHETSLCSENVFDETVRMTMKSRNIMISFYLPIWYNDGNSEKSKVRHEQKCRFLNASFAEDAPLFQSKSYRNVKIILQSKCCELTLSKNHMKLKCSMEKMRTILEMDQDQEVYSLPFVCISHVKLESEIHTGLEGLMQIFIEVQIDSADVGLSYQIFKFWSQNQFKAHESITSKMPSHCIMFKVRLMKGAVLLSDGRWSFHGPILEMLIKNMVIQLNQRKDSLEGSGFSDLLINYNNIDKVMWEPFVEPWSFQITLVRKGAGNFLFAQPKTTDICMDSTNQLKLNITEPLIEALFRLQKMISDALNQSVEVHESLGNIGNPPNDKIHIRRYAPYILCNDTSLPLTFHVSRGLVNAQDIQSLANRDLSVVQPGFSIPIYVEETIDEQFFRRRPAHSSELLIEKKLNAASHHMISIHFDGTSCPSKPLSMDLVGLSCFEVNFSNNKQSRIVDIGRDDNPSKYSLATERQTDDDHRKGLVVPVVFEVSMLQYSKMIRLYSTVILLNATSMPLELRFDIPFGVSPKILEPIQPGQELPLPLHLAEAGRIRWHPVSTNYLWSEAQSLPNILSQENRLGLFRSFVCYPAHPTSDPFRCCISVQALSLSSLGAASPSLVDTSTVKSNFKSSGKRTHKAAPPKKHIIHRLKLITPLLLKNYLPVNLSLILESGGVTHSLKICEGNFNSFFAVDSMHELEITYQMEGYRPVISKFPRAESFSEIAKFSGSKYFLVERISFYPYTSSGPLSITLEKTLDASCGAREISLSVSYLLYNCTGLLLAIVDGNQGHKGVIHVIPSSYQLMDQAQLEDEKHGLAFLSSQSNSFQGSLNCCSTSTGDNAMQSLRAFTSSSMVGLNDINPIYSSKKAGDAARSTVYGFSKRAKPYMYAPLDHIPASDLLVRLAVSSSHISSESMHIPAWSTPFPLVPASGSINVTIPKPNAPSAFLISVTSITVAEELFGRTRAITFQPRFVICNACTRDLSYKQKGTNNTYSLRVGQHSHLNWSDTSRELLVSLRFNGMGWQWSGSFLPDCLGDVQVKMRNYVSSELNMVRVEVQNADMALNDEKSIPKSNGSFSTQLILLSDDKTGFIPYRIDNFSMERLRIYQHKCESVETVVHPYTSCEYAWDEPCYPHRIIVEVPGERIVGTYNLDDVQEYAPVCFSSTSEKPDRRFSVSVHAEGATKVLSIIDSSYHIIRDIKGSNFLGFKEKRKADKRLYQESHFTEVIKFHLSFVGISLMSSAPQELIFACARETTVVLMQSSEQQKILSQILSLQIDNQLSDTLYPIIVYFDNDYRGRSLNHSKNKENWLQVQLDSTSSSVTCEPIFYFSAAKWRKSDVSLVSFEYITFRLASMCIELEEQILLCLFDFFRTVNSRLQRTSQKNFDQRILGFCSDATHKFARGHSYLCGQYDILRTSEVIETDASDLLPAVVPMGAPWQQIYVLARRQKKIYVENFELAPIKLSLSFSSTPLMIRAEVFAEVENLTRISSTAFQRGIMALVDVEGVPVHLRQLTLEHLMASPESIRDILVRHYIRQLLHEIYKLFGSAGVIGNPIGFARNVRLVIKDFLSISSRGILQSPSGLLAGVKEGSKSLFSNTIYALSSTASQFTKAAHKGIVAFTFDDQIVDEMDKQLQSIDVHGKGVLNEFLEGLTGLLQSPIRGAERHGLPGVLSGIAMGTAGLVARPIASILEATTKTAQSIRNRSSPHPSNRCRIRLPRPLARELPLSPYSWEEAIGASMIQQADMGRLKDEVYVTCKALRKAGRFILIGEKLVVIFSSSCLVDFGLITFAGVPANPTWVIEMEMSLESVVHVDRADNDLNIVGDNAGLPSWHKKGFRSRSATSAPFVSISVELPNAEEAEDALQVLLSTIELGKEKRGGVKVLHRINLS
ncbi:hypothetical protein KFK09_015510 [Dendrobium nobile]|uniref:Vacuolar protein sorting-associated protein 13A n=1 Tax=Dendrobium nobile TaxID=94219 RepID=A0A8T3B661_DENNO|nr:hypothetical protein KFK09_015510 [Dendrobium nobile]